MDGEETIRTQQTVPRRTQETVPFLDQANVTMWIWRRGLFLIHILLVNVQGNFFDFRFFPLGHRQFHWGTLKGSRWLTWWWREETRLIPYASKLDHNAVQPQAGQHVLSAAEPPYKVQQQWTTTSHFLTTMGSPTEPHPRLRNRHPGAWCSAPKHVICLHWMLWVAQHWGLHHGQKAVKRYCSKNSQDSEYKDKKSDDQFWSMWMRRRPMHITLKQCATKCAPIFDCSSTTLSAKNAITTSESAKNATITLSVTNATTTSNSSASASNTSISSTRGRVLTTIPVSCLNNGQQQVKCVVENLTIVHGRNNTY